MNDFIEDAKAWATMPIPGAAPQAEQRKMYDAMSIEQLAEIWRALQHVGLRGQTEGTWDTTLYFDALPHNEPERALDLVLAVLRSEQDQLVLMQLGDKFTTTLIHAHAGTLIDRLEREVTGNPKLRWLLVGAQCALEGAARGHCRY